MKFKFNSKYNTIAGYVIITFTICLLIIIAIFKISILQVYLNKLLKVTAPIIWGLVIAYLLNPILRFVEKYISKLTNRKKPHKKIARAISILITMTIFFAAIFALIASIVPEIISSIENILNNMQSYFDNIQHFVENKFEKLKNANPEIKKFIYDQMDTIESVALSMANSLQPQLENLFSKGGLLANLTGSALSFISGVKDFLIGAIVSVYLLFSKELFTAQAKKVVYAFFSEQKSSKILSFSRDANEKFISFLSGKALDSFIIGMICFVAMNVLDLPYIVLISVIVGVTNMIPFFGPIIGSVTSALLILLSNPSKTVAFIIMIIILQQLDGNVFGPKILGNQLGMNGFWILFSIVIGGGLFGFVGMILAVPCFAVIYPMFKETVNSRLVKKQLSVNTNDYFTEEKSIIVKDKKNKNK